jgi:hypothetical protein
MSFYRYPTCAGCQANSSWIFFINRLFGRPANGFLILLLRPFAYVHDAVKRLVFHCDTRSKIADEKPDFRPHDR